MIMIEIMIVQGCLKGYVGRTGLKIQFFFFFLNSCLQNRGLCHIYCRLLQGRLQGGVCYRTGLKLPDSDISAEILVLIPLVTYPWTRLLCFNLSECLFLHQCQGDANSLLLKWLVLVCLLNNQGKVLSQNIVSIQYMLSAVLLVVIQHLFEC